MIAFGFLLALMGLGLILLVDKMLRENGWLAFVAVIEAIVVMAISIILISTGTLNLIVSSLIK